MQIRLNSSDNFKLNLEKALGLQLLHPTEELVQEIKGIFEHDKCFFMEAEVAHSNFVKQVKKNVSRDAFWIEYSINARHLEDYWPHQGTQYYVRAALGIFAFSAPIMYQLSALPVFFYFSTHQDGNNEVFRLCNIRKTENFDEFRNVKNYETSVGIISGIFDPNNICQTISGQNELLFNIN